MKAKMLFLICDGLIPWVAFVAAGYGQKQVPGPSGKRDDAPPCDLSVAQPPTIRGIRLGMSAEDLLALFPGSRELDHFKLVLEAAKRARYYELADLVFLPPDYSSRAEFEGIDSILVRLFDERVTYVFISYHGHPWSDVDEMIASETPGLQNCSPWIVTADHQKSFDSQDFQITVSSFYTCWKSRVQRPNSPVYRQVPCSSIQFLTPSTYKQVQARKAEIEKAKREVKE